jgi:putative serine protease PepD
MTDERPNDPFPFNAGTDTAPQPRIDSPPAPNPQRGGLSRRLVAGVAALVLASGVTGGATGAWLASDHGSTTTTTLPAVSTDVHPATASNGTVAGVAAKVLPAVVSIMVRSADGSGGEGSGFVITPDGKTVTNNHVVTAASGGTITVQMNDGSTHSARVLGKDSISDLAVIQIQGVHDVPTLVFGRSATLQVGQPLVAVGSPLGLSGTVTSGIVSALNRPVRTGSETDPTGSTVIDAIQTDAAINPGNSGGPLVDMAGNVVGIDSAIATLGSGFGGQSGNIGVGFAIPVDQARQIVQQLINTGHATHGWLGVALAPDTSSTPTSGAQLASVVAGGPAAKAGLRTGDLVTKVDDRRIDSADALIAAVRSAGPHATVTITYTRGGTSHTVKVALGTQTGS